LDGSLLFHHDILVEEEKEEAEDNRKMIG